MKFKQKVGLLQESKESISVELHEKSPQINVCTLETASTQILVVTRPGMKRSPPVI